ncbi:MAG: ABC transporter permease, partial [Bacteroidota bacterium]
MKYKRSKLMKIMMIFILIPGLMAPLLCNDLPYFMSVGGECHFPLLHPGGSVRLGKDTMPYRAIDFRTFNTDVKWMPPVVYDCNTLDDLSNSYRSPFEYQTLTDRERLNIDLPLRYRHWLGTTRTGKDVLACIVYGIRTSLIVGSISVLLALTVGSVIGFIAGGFGNDRIKFQRGQILTFLTAIFIVCFDIARIRSSGSALPGMLAFCISLSFVFFFHQLILKRFDFFRTKLKIPIDDILTTFSSGFIALPQLILILGIMAFTGPSYTGVILCIGFTSWPMIARAVRIQSLKLRNETFIESARAAGYSPFRIVWHHYLPNMKEALLVTALTGFSGAVLTEAGLTFLGIGIPAGIASWGSLMAEARSDMTAWWLVVFPGFMLSTLTYTLYRYSE